MTIQELQQATSQDQHLQQFKEHIIRGWPDHRDQVPQGMRTYWSFCDELTVIGGIVMKNRGIFVSENCRSKP